MHVLSSAISITWKRNHAYGLRLVGDLTDGQMLGQPVAGRVMNHPAWILSHLNLYAGVANTMLRGAELADPVDHPHGAKSRPLAEAGAYPSRAVLIAEYGRLHEEGLGLLAKAAEAIFAAPTPLTRWRELHPTVGDMLVTLMVKHESGHLGQLSAWRRGMGLPSVAV